MTLTPILISFQIPNNCLGESLRKGKYILWNNVWQIKKQGFFVFFFFNAVIYTVQWVWKIVMLLISGLFFFFNLTDSPDWMDTCMHSLSPFIASGVNLFFWEEQWRGAYRAEICGKRAAYASDDCSSNPRACTSPERPTLQLGEWGRLPVCQETWASAHGTQAHFRNCPDTPVALIWVIFCFHLRGSQAADLV